MGFEQLAALRQQLTEQAEKERRARRQASPASDDQPASDARKGKPGGPSGRPGKPSAHGAKPSAHGRRPDADQVGAARSGKPAGPARAPRTGAPAPDVDPVVVTISRLQRKFPKAFPKKPAAKVPLKLGIHEELLGQAEALGLPAEDITLAIKTWCQGARYWACLVEDAARMSLEGEAVGVVTAAEAKRARQLAHRQRTSGAVKRKKAAKSDQPGDAESSERAGSADAADASADAQSSKQDAVAAQVVATEAAQGVELNAEQARAGSTPAQAIEQKVAASSTDDAKQAEATSSTDDAEQTEAASSADNRAKP